MIPDSSILANLIPFEPIFHTQAFGLEPADRDRRMSLNYWEIGASGRRYTREVIIRTDRTHFIDAEAAGWRTTGHALTPLSPDTYLITYTLMQGERLSRRATIWHRTESDWTILFHQGTLVSQPDFAADMKQ